MAEPWEYFHTKNILNKYGLPSGTFDPEGAWEQTYDIYFMNIRFKRGNSGTKPLAPEATLNMKAHDEGSNRLIGMTYSALLFEDKTQTHGKRGIWQRIRIRSY